MFREEPFEVITSAKWSDDPWANDQENRTFYDNSGFLVINEGTAEGIIVGANICTFNLLHGTEYMPSLNNSVLFIEDDYESVPHTFDRDLQSIIHQPTFSGVRGIVIGRFQKKSGMTNELLTKIIKTKKELNTLPVIANVDFGHTTPMITFPIGGQVQITTQNSAISIKIITH